MDSITFDLETVIKIIGWTAALVGFALAIKFGLNGLRADVKTIKAGMEKLLESDAEQNKRLTTVETETNERRGWIRRIEDDVKRLWEAVSHHPQPRDD